MKVLTERSYELEKMDVEGYSYEELRRCLIDIERINAWTRAHKSTLEFINRIMQDKRLKKARIVDIGFGSGDLLKQLYRLGKSKGYDFELVGLEINPWAIKIANELNKERLPIQFLYQDFFSYEEPVDFFVGSMLLHHLKEDEMLKFIAQMANNAKQGWLLHDLHRHWLPYYFIKMLTQLTNLSPMVQYDAPLSVARGFQRNELKKIAKDLKQPVNIHWKFPFKFLIAGEAS